MGHFRFGGLQTTLLALFSFGFFLVSAGFSLVFAEQAKKQEPIETGTLQQMSENNAPPVKSPALKTARQDVKVEMSTEAGEAGVKLCQETINQHLKASPVEFLPGRFQLSREGIETVVELAEILKGCKASKAIIAGHTDASGQAARNQRLSGQRAATVMGRLVRAGVHASRLRAVAYGAERPIVDNDTPENRALNRRIELKLY